VSLREEAAALSTRPGPQTSAIMRLVDSLDGDERDDVVGLVWDDVHTSSRAVAEVLTKHFGDRVGKITSQQVRNHRSAKPRP
jgi:hypothetical protein